MSAFNKHRRTLVIAAAITAALGAAPEPATAQAARRWSTVSDQFYLPADHNWKFRRTYPVADRLFNAFDYGHAILYETLYSKPNAPASELEDREYNFITRRLLVNPPRVPLEEGAIEVAYAKIAPEAKMMFDWAHVLHRQAYDVWADESIPLPEKDARIAELLAYYKSRSDVAFSSVPKTMDIMDGQYFSGAFREKYPRFNGIIWAYHWLQVGLYEPLIVNTTLDARQTGVTATVARFRQMLENPPQTMPHIMPMTAAVAPTFSQRYPEVAIIFDNLHMMHDVISDILASPEVPREAKGAEILRQVAMFRDSTSYATTVQGWWEMSQMMGANNMGGVAGSFLAALPEPTVPYGASMAGMSHGNMPGMQAQPGAQGMQGHANMPGMQVQPGAQGMQGHANTPGMQAQPGAQGMQGHANMPGMQAQPGAQGMQGHANTAGMQAQPGAQGNGQGGHANMPGMQAQPGAQGMQHGNMPGMQAQPGAQGMQGMQHGNMQGGAMNMGAMDMELMMRMHERMMADPVIRERMATDPVLQRMMQQMQAMPQNQPSGGMNMPGMNMGNMNMAGATEEDRRQAIEFIVRLLSDPSVEARVHADPELHRLWSDPEVQRRLAELRSQALQTQAAPPANPNEHRHR
ncbi:hypothetical protein [Longimicrobium sp.]|uniref:hypothetical protein n=1 Tax=Longimicrobium sp. TaxID=2029185 RepID=UPI002E33C56B|nr:hypothetical protein [Longimicrobium sp.]HEX6041912.1 hypothetical protein [Longimicrobium sp.]